MTKTKLQIMREKKGMTVEQLAEKIFETGKYATLDVAIIAIEFSEGMTEFYQITEKSEYTKDLSEALGCNESDLIEG